MKKHYAPMLDLWSFVHFGSGILMALIGIPLFWIFILGVGWEIVEHSLLEKLANFGGAEGFDNIVADIVLVFLGGAMWIFAFA